VAEFIEPEKKTAESKETAPTTTLADIKPV
jgi:hypothetical protein